MAPLTETEFWGELDALTQVYPGPVLAGASPVWASLARPAQLPPPGDWRQWLLIGGRGSGKTRAPNGCGRWRPAPGRSPGARTDASR